MIATIPPLQNHLGHRLTFDPRRPMIEGVVCRYHLWHLVSVQVNQLRSQSQRLDCGDFPEGLPAFKNVKDRRPSCRPLGNCDFRDSVTRDVPTHDLDLSLGHRHRADLGDLKGESKLVVNAPPVPANLECRIRTVTRQTETESSK